MSTVTSTPPPIAPPRLDTSALPVEINPAEEAGKIWLQQAGQLPVLAAMKNVWKITEAPNAGWPPLRMDFRAIAEDGRQFRLFQDLSDGKWYRELAPSIPGQPQ